MAGQLLHDRLVAEGIPIYGVSVSPQGATVYYAPEATVEQRSSGDAIAASFDDPLETRRLKRLDELREWWTETTEEGITPTGADYSLGAEADDVALLNGQFTLAQTAVNIGLKTSTDTFTILDIRGRSHLLTLSELTSVLLDYGDQLAALNNQYSTLQQAIEEAVSLEALNAIELP